jgi:hypothetical protein
LTVGYLTPLFGERAPRRICAWENRYGAELVVLTGTTAEFAVARPPRTRADAVTLAWEYFVYNDGYYDLYGADNLTQLAASLLAAPVWLAWWD